MDEQARIKVENYLKENDCSPLEFYGYVSSKAHLPPECPSVEIMVNRVLELTKTHYSITAGSDMAFQCSSGRSRSAIDIWRHIIYFYPEVTIYDVMHALYSMEHQLSGCFCNDVHRRVFRIGRGSNEQNGCVNLEAPEHDYHKDEFALNWISWKDI